MKEQISALVDGELTELEERRVLDALSKDSALRGAWERYYVMRNAIARQLDHTAAPGLAARIAQRIDAEHRSETGVRKGAIQRIVTAAAIAASVAGIAIAGFQWYSGPEQTITTVALPQGSGPKPDGAERVAATERPDLRPGLNPYLVGHNAFMPIADLGGMHPYARVVTYDRE